MAASALSKRKKNQFEGEKVQLIYSILAVTFVRGKINYVTGPQNSFEQI